MGVSCGAHRDLLLQAVHVPDADRPVIVAAGEQGPVGAECQLLAVDDEPVELGDGVLSGHLGQPDEALMRDRRQARPVGGEGQGLAAAGLLQQEVAGREPIDPGVAVGPEDGHAAAVAVEIEGPDRPRQVDAGGGTAPSHWIAPSIVRNPRGPAPR